jgi:hypothetical protein
MGGGADSAGMHVRRGRKKAVGRDRTWHDDEDDEEGSELGLQIALTDSSGSEGGGGLATTVFSGKSW